MLDELFVFHRGTIKYYLWIYGSIYDIWQWEIQLEAFTREAEWSEAKYVPSFHEYIENSDVSIAWATLVVIGVILTREVLTYHFFSQIYFRSNFG